MARAPRTLGNENYENQEITSELDLVEEPEDSVEAHIIEVERAETATEIEAIDGDQLDGDMDQLVRHAEVIETSLDDGGLDETAARQVDIAVESICNRWGFARKKLGTENFRSGSSRIENSKLALEGIGETIANGAKAFMEWIMKKIQEIKHLWQKYINVGKSSKKRIEKLRSRVDKLRGQPDKDEKVEGKKISKFFTMLPNTTTLTKMDRSSVEKMMSSFGDAVSAKLNSAGDALESDTQLAVNDNDTSGLIMRCAGTFTWNINGSEGKFKRLFPAGATDQHVHVTCGGLILGYKDRSGFANVMFVSATSDMITDAEMPALTPDEMEGVLDAAYDCAAKLDGYFRTMSKTDAGFEKLKRAIKKAESKYTKAGEKKDSNSADLKDKRNGVKAARNDFDLAMSLDNICRKVSVNFINGACAYVIESMKLYKDED